MIAGSDPLAIRSALEHVAKRLEGPATFVLIGGCNMAIRGIKSSTRDVDVVLRDTTDQPQALDAFKAAGFEVVDGYYLPGAPLDPHTMLEDATGMWVDLFLPERLFGDLDYSADMAARERVWFEIGPVRCTLADPSAVFLLKAVTGRWRADPERDLTDLVALLDAGLVDWRFVQDEWRRQRARHPGSALMQQHAQEAVSWLRAAGHRRLPWRP